MKTYLEERIEYYDDQYRNGNALISDKQFDRLEANLLRIKPNCDYFLRQNMLILPSLPKNQLKEFLEELLPNTKLLIEPKIDGCAIAIQYKDGKLEKSITRKGTDVTSKIIKIQNVPNKLPIQRVFQVRGELYAPNRASGISQRIASGYIRDREGFQENLSFCGFQILNTRFNQSEAKKHLKKLGFSTPTDFYCNFTSQVEILRKKYSEGLIFKDYPTDGIVVKINSRKLQLLREKSKCVYPHWQMAINL